MAKRAREAFFAFLSDGKRKYDKDQEVPAAVAKDRPELVYDDGAKATSKR